MTRVLCVRQLIIFTDTCGRHYTIPHNVASKHFCWDECTVDPRVLTVPIMIPYQTYRLIHAGLFKYVAAYSRFTAGTLKSVYVYNYFVLEGSGIL